MRRNLLRAIVLVSPLFLAAGPAWSQTVKSAGDTSSLSVRTSYYTEPVSGDHVNYSDPTEATEDDILTDLSDRPSVPVSKHIVPASPPRTKSKSVSQEQPEADAPIPPAPSADSPPAESSGSSSGPSCFDNLSPHSSAGKRVCKGGVCSIDGEDDAASATGETTGMIASPSDASEGGCGDSLCGCDCWPGCENCPQSQLIMFAGLESWRGVSDIDWPNNTGASFGLNYGTAPEWLRDHGIGFQVGGSYGIYDWNGRGSVADQSTAQQQIFLTTGFFTKANADTRWSAGIVYDMMINTNFGAAASDGTMGQWRGQLSYAFCTCNEIGLWGAARDRSMHQNDLDYHGVDQLNVFWHHKFCQGADSSLWLGVADRTKLGGNGSLGDFILGGTVSTPLSDRVALYSNFQYMHPTSEAGPLGVTETTWNVGFGLAFYIGGGAHTSTVAGSCWAPLMNVANNGTFMVDSNVSRLAP